MGEVKVKYLELLIRVINLDERKTPSQTERGVTDNRSLANPTDDVSKVIRTQKPDKINTMEGE